MAVQALAAPSDGGLKSVQDLYNLINGTTVATSGKTETTSSSQESMNAMLANILGGTSGLAAVSGAQRASGGYGGSTNTLLTNDLLTRAAAQVSAQNTTKTTSGGTVTTGGISAGGVGNVIGSTLIGQGASAGLKKVKDLLPGMLAGTAAASFAAGDAMLPGTLDAITGQVAGDAFLPGALAEFGASPELTSFSSGFDGAGAAAGAAGGAGIFGVAGDAFLPGALAGDAFLPGALSIAGDVGIAAGLGEGFGAAAGLGEIGAAATAAGEAAGFGEILSALLLWIICTELTKQHRMPQRYYVHGSKVFSNYPQEVKNGYYLWAIPSVAHLRNKPNSLYSRTLARVFNWRAENIAAHAGVKGARKLWKGAAVTVVLYPVCWLLGHTVCKLASIQARIDPTVVYSKGVA